MIYCIVRKEKLNPCWLFVWKYSTGIVRQKEHSINHGVKIVQIEKKKLKQNPIKNHLREKIIFQLSVRAKVCVTRHFNSLNRKCMCENWDDNKGKWILKNSFQKFIYTTNCITCEYNLYFRKILLIEPMKMLKNQKVARK